MDLCSNVFTEQAHSHTLLETALKLSERRSASRGLSNRDLDLIVQKIFIKKEGRRSLISNYWKKSAQERTEAVSLRLVSEELAKEGLKRYFERNGLLLENSLWRTRWDMFEQSKIVNSLSAMWSLHTIVTQGRLPISFPYFSFKMDPNDLKILMLEGISSAAGQAILKKNHLRMEVNHGYEVFNRYYSQLGMAFLAYLIYGQTEQFIKNHRQSTEENLFDIFYREFEKRFSPQLEAITREDILFETVIGNFQTKYNRLPTASESHLICLKIYQKECSL